MNMTPLVFIGVIWIFVAFLISVTVKSAKKAEQKKQASQRPLRPAGMDQDARVLRDGILKSTAAQEDAGPAPAQPTVGIGRHDDSLYQGSMNAVTSEGYDPCHDEQLAPLSAAESAVPAVETAQPGLQLSWTGSDVVRGIVMSEILNRR